MLDNSNTKNTSAKIEVPAFTSIEQKHSVNADFFVMKKIKIRSPKYGGKWLIVDDDDFERVNKITWTLKRSAKNTFSIAGWVPLLQKSFSLTKYLLDLHLQNVDVFHIDQNPFNNKRNNLVVVYPNEYILRGAYYELKIQSKKHGVMSAFFDKGYFKLVSQYQWRIFKATKSLGYYVASFEEWRGKFVSLFLHQLVMGFPKQQVDHIDRNCLNNRRRNLRLATISQNKMNRPKPAHNTSGFKGVAWSKYINKYVVHLTAGKKTYYGGSFVSIIEAAKKYNELALKYHKQFACLNPIPNE